MDHPNTLRKKTLAATLALILLLLFAVPKYIARLVWNSNMATVNDILTTKTFSLRQFEHSIDFFDRLTNIPTVGVDGNYIGLYPTDEFSQDVKNWDDWCKQHCDELYWDYFSWSVERRRTGVAHE